MVLVVGSFIAAYAADSSSILYPNSSISAVELISGRRVDLRAEVLGFDGSLGKAKQCLAIGTGLDEPAEVALDRDVVACTHPESMNVCLAEEHLEQVLVAVHVSRETGPRPRGQSNA